MPNISEGLTDVAEPRKAIRFATMAEDALNASIAALEECGWEDLASDVQKARQQALARRRQIERG